MFRRLFDWLALKPHVHEGDFARFQIPENARFRPHMPEFYPTYPPYKSVRREEGKVARVRYISGHPDLHHYLWHEAGAEIPRECCWVIQGSAMLANPETNIIFAQTNGMHGISMRMSDKNASSFEHRVEDYVVPPVNDAFGCRWVSGQMKVEMDRAMLAAAYEDSKTVQGKTQTSGESEPAPLPVSWPPT